MKQIINDMNAFIRQDRRQPRSNSFNVLNGCARFEHLKEC